ncbi:MAG: DMT family transporter [Rhizobiales bacterium]|nr:DMT family transporter [Hyphomicrobiales bacterium]
MTPGSSAPPGRLFLVSHLAVVAAMWGSSFIVMKLMAAELPPFVIASLRGLVAAATLALFFLATGRSLRMRRGETLPFLAMGMLHGWLPNALTVYAVAGLGAGLAAIFATTTPLVTAVLTQLLLPSDRLTGRQGVGLLAGFAGVGVLIGPDALMRSDVALWPALAMILTAVSYAIGNVYVRTLPAIPAERLAIGQQATAGLTALALALAFEPWSAWTPVPGHWVNAVLLGAVFSALPFTLFMSLIQRAGPVRATLVGYLVPLVAALLAVGFFGETLAMRHIVGGAIVMAGVALATRR